MKIPARYIPILERPGDAEMQSSSG